MRGAIKDFEGVLARHCVLISNSLRLLIRLVSIDLLNKNLRSFPLISPGLKLSTFNVDWHMTHYHVLDRVLVFVGHLRLE